MSLLLRHLEANGPLSRADLEAATRRQQQAGGSLDTAILELGLMTPLALDALLQSACGLPGAPVRLLERGPTRPWEHVPKDLVDIGWAMPLAAEDGRLIVAVHPDLPDAKLGQLYRLIRGFYPVVAPECCLAKVAVERTGAILAPRYALILLDYLEALRSTTPTVHLPASDAPLQDVPVPGDRQNAGPRPAAMSGPAVAARASSAPPVSSDSSASSPAATPVASDRAGAADSSGATPVSADLAAPVPESVADSPVPSGSSAEAQATAVVPSGAPDRSDDGVEPRPAAPDRSDSSAEAAPEPASSDSTEAAPEPASSSSTAAAPEPVPSDNTAAAPEPVSSDSIAAAPEPVPSDSISAAPEPVPSDSTTAASEPASSDSTAAVAPPTTVGSDAHDLAAASPAPDTSTAQAEADRADAPSPLAVEPASASAAAPAPPAPEDSLEATAPATSTAGPSGAEPAGPPAPASRGPEAPARSESVPADRAEEAAPRPAPSVTDAPAPELAPSRATGTAPMPIAAAVANRPPVGMEAVPVAPDAPLVAPRGFEGFGGASLSGLAIAPDTPLIILPAEGAAPERTGPAKFAVTPVSSSRETAAWPAAARERPSQSPALERPAAAPASERPSPVSSDSHAPTPAAHGPSNGVAHPTAAAVSAPITPVPTASSSPAEPDQDSPASSTSHGMVESSSRKPPPPPQAMVMTLAQRLDAARAALATARERDRITEALVRAASLIAPRVALFGVKREGLRVLAAPGSALQLAEGVVLALPEGGLLDRAVTGQGPLHLLAEPSLSSAVGQPLGIPCVFEPVLAGGRTVLMLYLDRAGVAFDPRERTVVRELCDTARQSLEALLRLLGWVVPGGTPGAGPADRSRPAARPHLATPVVTVDESDAASTNDAEDSAPQVAASAPAEPTPAAEEHEASLPPAGGTVEPGFGDSASTSRSRGRGNNRGRAIITLKNPIRRDELSTVTPLPVRPESSAATRAPTLVPEEAPTEADIDADADESGGLDAAELEREEEEDRRDGPGLGLAPVPVPLGPEGGDSPLVARFAALYSKPLPSVTIDLSDRPNTFGHARSDMSSTPAESGPDMPGWIASSEASGIEDPLPMADALRAAAAGAERGPDLDPAATLPGAPRVVLDEAARARAAGPDPEFDAWPRAASDTPTVLDLSPPPAHEPPVVETRAAPDAETVLDIPPLDPAVPPSTLIPNLIAPPGTPGAGRRRRTPAPVEEEPVLVIPKTLRRQGGLTATPHPMARRSDPSDSEDSTATLSIPTTLIGPRSGRRRGKQEPRSEASSSALSMPRLVRESGTGDALDEPASASTSRGAIRHAPDDSASASTSRGAIRHEPDDSASASISRGATRRGPDDSAGASTSRGVMRHGPDEPASASTSRGAIKHVVEDMPPATGPEEQVAEDSQTPAPAPAEELAAEEPEATGAGAALSDDEIDAIIEGFLQDPAEWTSVSRLRALDQRGLARLAARFPGPIDLANATNFPPPSAHGPLLRACVELGHAVSPHILALFASVRPQIRFYAAFLFQELRDPRCLRPLGELAFDTDPDVRLIATRVLESYSRVPDFVAVAAEIREDLDSRDRDRQLLAVEAAGTLRDTLAVPRLIDLLAVRDKHVREAALEALCSITAKHHGYRAARWRAWYAEHGHEPRIEWVIDGLRHRDEAVRRWAADELARITGQRIPFPAEGDRRSRDLALRAWQAWWDSNREDFTPAAEARPDEAPAAGED
ncbi:hypothetical protein [Nannocystis pusilla]|uniref:Type II secretion system protein GspE N-terminal domain-containing protein n=1 Tax=Nannocystis pusilla TaxID=889268 RepID=A0ABS7TLJ5_9BACT|nr:hypothetical protein [Nannocystis pusilla]MBZ5708961.1 hypothetical protein [Nannocystis pusilla]